MYLSARGIAGDYPGISKIFGLILSYIQASPKSGKVTDILVIILSNRRDIVISSVLSSIVSGFAASAIVSIIIAVSSVRADILAENIFLRIVS